MRSLRPLSIAFTTLTTARIPLGRPPSEAELREATAFYPLVGLAVGLLPAAILTLPLPTLPRALLALVAWIAVTGALHLDGWADCCDAAFAPARDSPNATRRRRLEILRDPHAGSFATAGVALLLMAKWVGLAYAPAIAPLLAAPVARWGMVHALRTHAPARNDGLAAALAGGAGMWTATGFMLAALAPVILLGESPARAALSVALGAAAALGTAAFLARRFGGVTGDVCGAAGELAEVVVLWGWLPWAMS